MGVYNEQIKETATEMFYKHLKKAKKYSDEKELKLINASKAAVLSELLEKYGARPKIY